MRAASASCRTKRNPVLAIPLPARAAIYTSAGTTLSSSRPCVFGKFCVHGIERCLGPVKNRRVSTDDPPKPCNCERIHETQIAAARRLPPVPGPFRSDPQPRPRASMKPGLSRGLRGMGSPFYPRFHASDAGRFSVEAFTMRRRRILRNGLSSAGDPPPSHAIPRGKIGLSSCPSSQTRPQVQWGFVSSRVLSGWGKKLCPGPRIYAAAVSIKRGTYARRSRSIAHAMTSSFRITATMASLRRSLRPAPIRWNTARAQGF